MTNRFTWKRAARYAVAGLFFPALLLAHAAGPGAYLSGAPGDDTCSDCHGNGTPNKDSTGSITLTFPSGTTYTAGQTIAVTVTISDPTARRWGFEVSPRLPSSPTPKAGGTITLTDSLNTQLQNVNGLQFVEQTSTGTYPKQLTSASWTFKWTAPTDPNAGPVDFYAAGNAANGNGDNDIGDHVYTTKATLTPATAVGVSSPTITSGGVVNGASFKAGVVPGAWVTIQGANLATNTRTWDASKDFVNGALPTQLDGTSVTIDGKPAAVYYISPTQLNVLAPPDVSYGPVDVVVSTAGIQSSASSVTLQAEQPAFFTLSPSSNIAALNADFTYLADPAKFPTVTARKAKPGDTVLLYGTGFGATNPPVPPGQLLTTNYPVITVPTVTIGGLPAQVTFAGVTSPGLYQLNVVVPNVPDGNPEVIATVHGVSSQSGAFIPVQH